MSFSKDYEQWKRDPFFDETIRNELNNITDQKEIEDRFYRDLEFGTGGLRGIMGAGTNRFNKYTIGKATTGLGKYLLDEYGPQECRNRGVVVGYDTRNHSAEYACSTANVLSAMGIRVYLHDSARPTPQLSFAVREFQCLAGVVITASHNPKDYNGYKVYDQHGCQFTPDKVKKMIPYINSICDYHCINFCGVSKLIQEVDITEKFVQAVLKQSLNKCESEKRNLKIIYTPIHGTGRVPVWRTLKNAGFTFVDIIKEQMDENGEFPTVASPNPEERSALDMAIKYAEKVDADIVLGTDPDSDRVGVAVKTPEGYCLMTGNQIGALLMDYILRNLDLSQYQKPAIVKTIVTSELGAEIARKKGITVFSTLTGFKFIGEKITQFEQAKITGNQEQNYDYIFGYEESYGYLAGTHVRDKDAVVSCMLICEMAAAYKAEGKNLVDQINQLYKEFGYYLDYLDSFTLKGKDGLEKINSMMHNLRTSESPFSETVAFTDYSLSVKAECGFGYLPKSDVLRFTLKDGSWIAVRPSGTEPKIKIYYSIKGDNRSVAEHKFKEIRKDILVFLGLP